MKRTPIRLVAFAAAALLALSACGSDSNDESSSTEAPEVTEPVSETTEPVSETTEEVAEDDETIVGIAASNDNFDSLVAALHAADLVDTLSAEGPYTVFAPNDDAFAALPDGLVDCLLLPENVDSLTAILTYHVLEGVVTSSDVVTGEYPTVQGESITVELPADLSDGVPLNGTATIFIANVEASNGVIHIIDGVLVPPSIDVDAFLASCPA